MRSIEKNFESVKMKQMPLQQHCYCLLLLLGLMWLYILTDSAIILS